MCPSMEWQEKSIIISSSSSIHHQYQKRDNHDNACIWLTLNFEVCEQRSNGDDDGFEFDSIFGVWRLKQKLYIYFMHRLTVCLSNEWINNIFFFFFFFEMKNAFLFIKCHCDWTSGFLCILFIVRSFFLRFRELSLKFILYLNLVWRYVNGKTTIDLHIARKYTDIVW